MATLIWLLGCGRSPGIGGCAELDGQPREECRFEEAKKLLADPRGFTAAVDTIDDATARDLLLVRLAFDTPAQAHVLCGQVRTPVGRDRCQQIVGRPHLRGEP